MIDWDELKDIYNSSGGNFDQLYFLQHATKKSWDPGQYVVLPYIDQNIEDTKREWCRKNLSHIWAWDKKRLNVFWFFEDENEALWFKMVWK